MVLKKQLVLNEEIGVGLWPYLKKKHSLCVCVMWGHNKKVAVHKPGREHSPETEHC